MIRKPELLSLDRCASLLGLSSSAIRKALRKGQFAVPAGSDDQGQPYWHEADVYEWAASIEPDLADRIPVDYWSTPAAPAAYAGAYAIGDFATALGWQTPLGELRLAWDHAGGTDIRSTADILVEMIRAFPSAAGLIVIGRDFGFYGQALWAILPGAASEGEYEICWSELSRVLGQPVPYWPATLRIAALLQAWHPGAATAVAAAVTDLDISPVLRLAAIAEHGSPAQQVLLNLAQTWHSQATDSAARDLEMVGKTEKPGTTVIAASPLRVPRATLEDLEESVSRAGWLEILSRQDNLAADCVRQKMMWDHGDGFPASNPENIDPASTYGREWAQRLIPAPRTAAIEVLDPRQSATAIFQDPATDAAVVRDAGGKLLAAIPQRLPATSRLAELILDHPIWVRTADGTLYPAPKDHYFGLSWGYRGSGPGSLAVLADRLLSDINAAAADTASGAPPGLHQLMQERLPIGTVLTRAQLEDARSQQPEPDD